MEVCKYFQFLKNIEISIFILSGMENYSREYGRGDVIIRKSR